MNNNPSSNKQRNTYFLLVFALSIPFWILGFVSPDTTKTFPLGLPISALMTFCPLIAAAILVYKKQKIEGVKQLIKQVFDFKKILDKKWYIAIVFLLPSSAGIVHEYPEQSARECRRCESGPGQVVPRTPSSGETLPLLAPANRPTAPHSRESDIRPAARPRS